MTQRVLAAAAAFTAVVVLAGCGGESTGTRAEKPSSIAPRTTASEPTAQQDKLVDPASTDRDVNELTGFVSPTAMSVA